MSAKELMAALEAVDACNEVTNDSYDHPLYKEAAGLANETLITDDGHCHIPPMRILKDHGYKVFPVEQDSFGWLVGGIRTPAGKVITYG